MHLNLYRYSTTPESTLGALHVDGAFECYILEDTKQVKKVAGKTRIDDGLYTLAARENTPMANRYKEKYPWHKWGMVWVKDTPRHKWVYFHPGNTSEHTEGCLLTGDGANNNGQAGGRISASLVAYRRFYQLVVPAIWHNDASLRVCNMG